MGSINQARTGHRIAVHADGAHIVIRVGPTSAKLSHREVQELIGLLQRAHHAAEPDAG